MRKKKYDSTKICTYFHIHEGKLENNSWTHFFVFCVSVQVTVKSTSASFKFAIQHAPACPLPACPLPAPVQLTFSNKNSLILGSKQKGKCLKLASCKKTQAFWSDRKGQPCVLCEMPNHSEPQNVGITPLAELPRLEKSRKWTIHYAVRCSC